MFTFTNLCESKQACYIVFRILSLKMHVDFVHGTVAKYEYTLFKINTSFLASVKHETQLRN